MPCFLCQPRTPEDTGIQQHDDAILAMKRGAAAARSSSGTATPGVVDKMLQEQSKAGVYASNSTAFGVAERNKTRTGVENNNGDRLWNSNAGETNPRMSSATSSRTSMDSSQQEGSTTSTRRRFHNIHPAGVKIKAKLDLFESGRANHNDDAPDMEATETDLTETTTFDEEEDAERFIRRRQSLLPPTLPVKDCKEDPYEWAYLVWYKKDLLYFRPKGVSSSE